MKIYTASKTKHAPMWRDLRSKGWPIISTWIDEAGPGETKSLAELWFRCIEEVVSADVLILAMAPDDVLKGALVEVGAAIACGIPVLAVGVPPGWSWRWHPLVQEFDSVAEALHRLNPEGPLWLPP